MVEDLPCFTCNGVTCHMKKCPKKKKQSMNGCFEHELYRCGVHCPGRKSESKLLGESYGCKICKRHFYLQARPSIDNELYPEQSSKEETK